MKKILVMMAMLAVVAPKAFAADAVSEDQAVDINLYLRAELAESLKVTISNDDMVVDPLLPTDGTIHLDGSDVEKIDVVGSRLALACKNSAGPIVYVDADNSCSIDATGAGKAIFHVSYDYKIELSGAGTITLDLALNSLPPAADTNFQNSSIDSPEAVVVGPAQAIQIAGLVHDSAGTIKWDGEMQFDAGASFEDNIVVDISLVP
jgi:hypothetical protein